MGWNEQYEARKAYADQLDQDEALMYEYDTKDQMITAHSLLSSLEAWDRTPENHRAETPKRFVQALKEMTTPEEFKFTTFPATSQDMVVLSPIPFAALCAHHVLPFHGHASIGYVPDERIAGLSKFARAVRELSKGFHIQEELNASVADFLEENLHPLGVIVQMRAEHMCMALRGAEVSGVITTTTTVRGVFADHTRTAKAEFLETIR